MKIERPLQPRSALGGLSVGAAVLSVLMGAGVELLLLLLGMADELPFMPLVSALGAGAFIWVESVDTGACPVAVWA
jgi:hypothetical protein